MGVGRDLSEQIDNVENIIFGFETSQHDCVIVPTQTAFFANVFCKSLRTILGRLYVHFEVFSDPKVCLRLDVAV